MQKLKITKPIRLIELFAGIGTQAMALQRLQDEGLCTFERYKAVEFDKYCIDSYNRIHGTNIEITDIKDIHAENLEIVDTDKYEYIMFYSFPCTDLSIAGDMKGMSKESGTRSGLLWEVERLLNECSDLPQILIMENVTQVHSKKNIKDFNEWIDFLNSKGYKNFYQDLNSKDYGIPQNRNRCIMVSLLNNETYIFPEPVELKLKMKDLLEGDVDSKYFLSDSMFKYIACRGTNGWKNSDSRINKKNCKTH